MKRKYRNKTIKLGALDIFCPLVEIDTGSSSEVIGKVLSAEKGSDTVLISFHFEKPKPKPKYTSFPLLNYWWSKK